MKIYQVDAFTSEKYSGNPAWVSIIEEFPPANEMQNIASEMNLSETAFVKKIWDDSYEIKFYTPEEEIDLCGHATLSSAHILFENNLITGDVVKFKANLENVAVKSVNSNYAMDFPLWKYEKIDDINNCESNTWIKDTLEIYDTSIKWKVVILKSKDELINIQPDFWKMKGSDYWNVVVTCAWDEEYDYYMRCFVTDCWINEDPVTWSIECFLAPLWGEKLNKKKMKSYQCSSRGWEKTIELMENRVNISWEAITIFEIDVIK